MGLSIERPGAPGSQQQQGSKYRPDQLDADLAAAEMAREIVHKLDRPSIISKKFAVRYGLFKALNHTSRTVIVDKRTGEMVVLDPGNETGYDCRSRLEVYDAVAMKSVNIDGAYFNQLWSYLMKPKFIIQGGSMLGMPGSGFEPEQPGIFSRLAGFIFGKKGGPGNNGQP